MADGGEDVVANFMAITGADDGVAVQMLEAANFVLEDAVNLFFAADAGGAGGRGGGGAAGAGGAGSRGGSAPPADIMDEDGVRAPLPTKVERLYGDHFDPRAMAAAHYRGLSGRPPPGGSTVDVFRDFKAESAAAGAAAQAAGADAAGGSGAAGPGVQGLSGLFKLPDDLVFPGNLDMAKARAAQEGKWLLFNVQSATEFASHRLNRDTWSQEALKEVLKGTFVFFQTSETSADGRALIKAYRLDSLAPGGAPLPATLVVDPLTNAQLWHRAGFVDAEKLMEELVPFMDHGPLDAGASSIAQNSMKRNRSATAVAGAAGGAGGAAGQPGRSRTPMTEDEELALAIAMSMERGGAGASGAAMPMDEGVGGSGGDADLDDLDEAAIWEQIQAAERQKAAEAASSNKSPEELAAEALARVPPEPADGDPESVRVALRLPDGRRLQRRFRGSDSVRALFDLAAGNVPEAAAGKGLVISHAMPGGAVLSDQEQTLAAAGVAGAMLAVKLAD
ncbi:hypothetical protein GPECTOR_1g827 [Gonium pectorale]|uniref:UBX domain-containing protein n=1 Tax=Gonium pectorale TaxID=33097 RepID=A0A150H445_GONPE|nr:hypothetical protein GPECTOR_1g827 [Gonium pectorale]|eukprot:KXZ56917.1 hypothetical protein GPECTOR_1g827 [Gonium pectorale]